MKDHRSPYRLCSGNPLPKFESSKNPASGIPAATACPKPLTTVHDKRNPFSVSAKPMVNLSLFDAELKPVATSVTAVEQVAAPTPAEIPLAKVDNGVKVESRNQVAAELPVKPIAPDSSGFATPKAPVGPAGMTPVKPADRAHLARTERPSLFQGWMKKLNPLAFLNSRDAEGNRPRGRAQVQGEFLLQNVKPVRNDLHDSDIELVAAKQPVREVVAPQPLAVEVASSGEGAVGRITTRYFGGAKLQAK